MNDRLDSNIGETLQDQLARLSSEVASLQKKLRRHGISAYRDARDMGEDASDWIREQAALAIPEIRRGARHLQRTARDNPRTTLGVAAAGMFVLGMAVAMMMRR